MSQSYRVRLFFRWAFDSAKFKLWICFACLFFFSVFLWTYLSKYRWKDMTDTIKHFEQTSPTLCSDLYLCYSKIKFHISYRTKLWPTQIWNVCCSTKKNAFRSCFSICHKLWEWVIPELGYSIFFSIHPLYMIYQSLPQGECDFLNGFTYQVTLFKIHTPFCATCWFNLPQREKKFHV